MASGLASSALATVVAFQTYELTRDPLALGLLGLVEAAPALSLALVGGHVADRRDRRSIILLTGAVAAVAVFALSALSADPTRVGFPAILGLIFVTGIVAGFQRPAQTAFEAQVVPADRIPRGYALMSSASQSSAIVGPALGGIAYAVVGVALTYAGIAALLVASVLVVATIPPKPVPPPLAGERMRESLGTGIRFVRRTPVLIGSMSLDLFAVLFGGAVALLPIFADQILHVGPAGLGLLRTAPSVGALVAMLVATRYPAGRRAGAALLVCVAGFGVSILVFALSTSFLLSLAALFVSGLTDGVSMVIRNVTLRVVSPEAIRGRVAAVNWVFIGASNEIGAFESGVAARLVGTVPSVAIGGVLTLVVVGLVAFLVPELRRLNLDERTVAASTDVTAAALPR